MRWAAILRGLGHRVRIAPRYDGSRCDLLLALHARKSAAAVLNARGCPVILALTGTDVYHDIRHSRDAQHAMETADRLVALQPLAAEELPEALRSKVRVIYQSAERTNSRTAPARRAFSVVVAGHLRKVKDPFRAAMAARRLPADSRIEVLHLGEAIEPGMAEAARKEEERNPRYRWAGPVPARRARRAIASSRLLVLSSRMEGGANVISESVVDGVPVLASRIPGSIGLLGPDYPGYFPPGDTAALAALLARAESDPAFYGELKAWCRRLAPQFSPARERAAWRALLRELLSSRPSTDPTARESRR